MNESNTPGNEDQRGSDFSDVEVLEIHRAALREQPDPGEGRERGPWWLWTGIIIAIFSGGFYLGRFGGAFFKNVFHIGYIDPSRFADVSPEKITPGRPAPPEASSVGGGIYSSRCVVCHQSSGGGLPNVFPPLAGSEWVLGDAETLIRILSNGMNGPVSVKGQTYNGAMPAWAGTLTPEEIASIATYIRSSWGNQAGAVSPEEVKKVQAATPARNTPWTAPELSQLRKGS